jgi:hypothetical protein
VGALLRSEGRAVAAVAAGGTLGSRVLLVTIGACGDTTYGRGLTVLDLFGRARRTGAATGEAQEPNANCPTE